MNVKILYVVIFVSSLLFFTVPVNAYVIINEIMYNPTSTYGGTSNEWVELYNPTDATTNLTGWVFKDKGSSNTSLSGILQPNSYLIIADNATKFNETYNCSCFVIDGSLGLSNSGDTIWIWNSSGQEVDLVSYQSSWGGNGNNKTLERIDPSGSNASSNWAESTTSGGTPGQRNSITPSNHDLAIYAENISFTPSDPSPRTGVNLTITASNLGITNETNVNISIYNISNSATTFIDSKLLNMTKQSSTNFTTTWNSTIKGNFTILVSISNVSNESNLTNNNATKNITIDFHLILNEIMYNPPAEIGSDSDYEWLEIYNNASYSENLTGWVLKCDSSSKSLNGNLDSDKYLVFSKDRTQFYKYYSSSIGTDSESCSFNNDGDTIRLVFNDSNIYNEEAVAYQPSWGADGTGYTLEKINPNTNNAVNNWAESKAYSGTPGARNNPDNKIKQSLKQTEIVYKTPSSSSSSFSTTPTPANQENYEIISFQDTVNIGEEFTTVVKLQSDIRKTFSVYSYVFDGKKLLSEGYDGNEWQSGWTANEQEVTVGPKPENAILKNKIKLTTSPGSYKFRVRIKGEKDLTKDILVLPRIVFDQENHSQSISSISAITCRDVNGIIEVQIKGNSKASLYIFSKNGFEIRNVTVDDESTERIEANGYAYILLVKENSIQDKCYVEMGKPKSITGKTTLPTATLIEIIYQWFKTIFNS